VSHLLSPGQIIGTGSGSPCIVGHYLGSGGQGEVYSCKWSDETHALKWYYQASATAAQRACLEQLVKEISPSPHFLWPEDIAFASGLTGFGYLMRLREPHFRSLNELMHGKLDVRAIVLIDASIALAKALRTLHTRGFCYRDINFGNAFIDPKDGQVLICDNDNVTINRTAWSGVNGTIQFMAPEVLRGHPPSTVSDQHSLSVLLFHMLFMGHPLMGRKMLSIRCWDGTAQHKLFAQEPVFIFDPHDESNAATSMAEDPSGESGGTASLYWNIYPNSLRQTLIKAFTVGLKEPSARPTELEWLGTLSKLRDCMFRCRCGAGNYHDPAISNNVLQSPPACWSCGNVPTLPMRIRIDRKIVMLNSDTQLYPHHIAGAGADYDYSQSLAAVIRHPTVRDRWGLRNTGKDKWVAQLAGGAVKDVPPGSSVPLMDGTRIFFGSMEGLIRA
jgi:eukaryotic-like serine/threonine-protein kinase